MFSGTTGQISTTDVVLDLSTHGLSTLLCDILIWPITLAQGTKTICRLCDENQLSCSTLIEFAIRAKNTFYKQNIFVSFQNLHSSNGQWSVGCVYKKSKPNVVQHRQNFVCWLKMHMAWIEFSMVIFRAKTGSGTSSCTYKYILDGFWQVLRLILENLSKIYNRTWGSCEKFRFHLKIWSLFWKGKLHRE